MKNFFTIDVEEWFQVFYLHQHLPPERWVSMEPKFELMMTTILDLLQQHHVKGTFFCVGWLADYYPALIKAIATAGHEIASHGYWHQTVSTDVDIFYQDIVKAKTALEKASGMQVRGYRAPGYSIKKLHAERYIEAIQSAGYYYDSSVLSNNNEIHVINGLIEVPPTAIKINKSFYPANGGFFFRALPYRVFKQCIKKITHRHRIPLNFYIHSWEVMPYYPRLNLPRHKKFIQYYNLYSVQQKLTYLLADYEFDRIDRSLSLSSTLPSP